MRPFSFFLLLFYSLLLVLCIINDFTKRMDMNAQVYSFRAVITRKQTFAFTLFARNDRTGDFYKKLMRREGANSIIFFKIFFRFLEHLATCLPNVIITRFVFFIVENTNLFNKRKNEWEKEKRKLFSWICKYLNLSHRLRWNDKCLTRTKQSGFNLNKTSFCTICRIYLFK